MGRIYLCSVQITFHFPHLRDNVEGGKWKLDSNNYVRCVCSSSVLRWHAFGRGNGKFWLDDVKCSGEEESIDKCSHRPWGWNNCLPFNQAGTVCKRHMSDLVIEPEPSISSREVLRTYLLLILFLIMECSSTVLIDHKVINY